MAAFNGLKALARRHPRGIFLVLALLTTIAYLPTLSARFVYDDERSLVKNSAVRNVHLLEFFRNARTLSHPAGGMFYDGYRPLQVLAFSLDYQAWKLIPLCYHLQNILLHLFAGWLVWLLLQIIFKDIWASGAGTLIFLAHPIQVETVAWVTQLSNILCGIGVLAALVILLKSPRFSWPRALTAAVIFILALFSKETAAVTPLLFLLAVWHLRPISTHRAGAAIAAGMIALTLGYLAVRYHVVGQWSTVAGEHPPLKDQLLLSILTLPVYLGKLLIPVALRCSYDYPLLRAGMLLVRGTITLGFLALTFYGIYQQRIWGLALGWIFIALLPALHIIPIVPFVAERFLYLPMVGLAIGTAWVFKTRKFARGWIGLWGAYLFIMTYTTVPNWDSNETMWKACINAEPGNTFAQLNYADSLEDPALMEYHYKQVIALRSNEWTRHAAINNLAWLYLRENRTEEAYLWALAAVRLRPDNPISRFNLIQAAKRIHARSKVKRMVS